MYTRSGASPAAPCAAAGRPDLPALTTPPLREAIEAMLVLLDEAVQNPVAVCGERAEAWSAASQAARRRVVRMSLEMRMVVSVGQDGSGTRRA